MIENEGYMAQMGYNQLMKVVPRYVGVDEKLLAVGNFVKKPSYLSSLLTLGISRVSTQFFHIGVTSKRIIILPINRFNGKINESEILDIDYSQLHDFGNYIMIISNRLEKPLKLFYLFGIESLSGLNKSFFLEQIESGINHTKNKSL